MIKTDHDDNMLEHLLRRSDKLFRLPIWNHTLLSPAKGALGVGTVSGSMGDRRINHPLTLQDIGVCGVGAQDSSRPGAWSPVVPVSCTKDLTMRRLSDNEILELYRNGQGRVAGDHVVRCYQEVAQNQVGRYLQRFRDLVRVVRDKEMLIFQALTRVHKVLEKRSDIRAIGGLVCRAAKWEVLTAVREEFDRRSREVLAVELRQFAVSGVGDDAHPEDFLERLPDLESNVEALAQSSETFRAYLKCLEELEKEERTIVRLHIEMELSFSEAAADPSTNLKRGGVVSTFERAKAKLKTCLEACGIHPR